MPIYEYRCGRCGEVRKKLRPISEHRDPLVAPCVDRPLGRLEVALELQQKTCTFDRILSATQTNFKFADKSARKERG